MIAANVQAAGFLKKHKLPALFRIHGKPDEERIEELKRFLSMRGVLLEIGGDLKPARPAESSRGNLRPTGCRGARERDHPLAAAGALPAAQHRSLRPRPRGVCPLHFADPPLPGPARAPRDPPCPGRRHFGQLRPFGARDGGARHGVLVARAPRRRGRAFGGRLAQVRVHASAHRRGVRRRRDRRNRFRPVRAAEGDAGRRPRARHRAAGGLLPLPRGSTARWSASARACASRSATSSGCGSCGWIPPSARSTSSTSPRPARTTIRAAAPARRPRATNERLAGLRPARRARRPGAPPGRRAAPFDRRRAG